jgi:hypothetical protein
MHNKDTLEHYRWRCQKKLKTLGEKDALRKRARAITREGVCMCANLLGSMREESTLSFLSLVVFFLLLHCLSGLLISLFLPLSLFLSTRGRDVKIERKKI